MTLNNHWLGQWKQDSGSNCRKGYSKVLHHTVKSSNKTQYHSIKVAIIQNNKKKRLVFTQNRLIFVYGKVFKDRSRNSATVKVFTTTGNGRKLQRASSDIRQSSRIDTSFKGFSSLYAISFSMCNEKCC